MRPGGLGWGAPRSRVIITCPVVWGKGLEHSNLLRGSKWKHKGQASRRITFWRDWSTITRQLTTEKAHFNSTQKVTEDKDLGWRARDQIQLAKGRGKVLVSPLAPYREYVFEGAIQTLLGRLGEGEAQFYLSLHVIYFFICVCMCVHTHMHRYV